MKPDVFVEVVCRAKGGHSWSELERNDHPECHQYICAHCGKELVSYD